MKVQVIATMIASVLVLAACRNERPASPATPPPAEAPAEGGIGQRQEAPPPDSAPSPGRPPAAPPTAAPPVDPVAPPQAANPAGTPQGAAGPLEVIETESGLIIEILREGEGEVVRPGDTIVVHYRGTLDSGRVFDSSYERGEPARLGLSGVIRGWQEGIPGMKVGGKRRLIIPPELGYGRRGSGNIPPNSLLIFELEVLDIIR